MQVRIVLSFLLLFSAGARVAAQQSLKGKMFDLNTDSVLAGVTIYNATKNIYALSGTDGTYAVTAAEGDRLIFSSVGYRPDTVKVAYYMFLTGYDIPLTLKNGFLKSVTVLGSYQADSIRRHEEYKDIFEKPKPARLPRGNVPPNGFGVTFNPVIIKPEKERQKEKLKKQLIYQEEQAFVDYSFSRSYVEKITGLHGDSLRVFMLRYRPSYTFCRTTSKVDMLVYINDKLKIFMKHEEEPLHQ
jgi:hypothetical protein